MDWKQISVLIFDLDGTLIDSKLDLALSVNAARRHLGLGPLDPEIIFGYVGQGAPMLIRRSLGSEAHEEQITEALRFFLNYYRQHMLDHTVTYPGVRAALDRLDGLHLTVLTNKPVRFSQEILIGLGIAEYFRFVFGGNSFEKKKPDPMGVHTILERLRCMPEEAMVVGDSEIDVLTARNAGTWACGVSYGLGSHHLKDCPPDVTVDNLLELAELLRPDRSLSRRGPAPSEV
jgi:phosphoglycolate phosphatase